MLLAWINAATSYLMPKYIHTDVKTNGYAVVTIKREPVNSMNLDVWTQLLDVLEALEGNSQVRGVIFCSGLRRSVFTAGNDLNELYAPRTSLERYTAFTTMSNQFLARLYRTKLITICAIRGACPAGGCCLSLCCDFRVMSENGTIGLNEAALGIPVPTTWIQLMSSVIGQGRADKLLQFGTLVDASQARQLGLIDEVVKNEEEALARAEEIMAQLMKTPDDGRHTTKSSLRNELSMVWGDEKRLKEEAVQKFQRLTHPTTIKSLDGVFTRLQKSKI
ncbi:ClpP/crotonase [Basidiobolus meristosporus CBS 931.73]|uniref:ClpP/crotonase n=1 Tax=Basidiobolus meristosporus CBS 931.73 TaxID=1314790 RepID=A0A1Y1Z5R6_9FUNG|nr:ClpP/crotonase [Basidiobolus meristosporus CBS 931.73]|eukprot:ORY05464.1 ClpP/crotonase [Basidiobolus meristosporus CBS 931.73]